MSEQTLVDHGAYFQTLPLGSIKPAGWLKNELRLQADGFTGHLEEVWPDVGVNSGWLGGTGESWERGPYYLDGLVPLAYLLDDSALMSKAQKWIEWILGSQLASGWFGPTDNDDWWSRMVVLKALMQYQEATHDERVIPFMLKYAHYQLEELSRRPLSEWAVPRGADNVVVLFWLYDHTQDTALLSLATLILEQTTDWPDFYAQFPFTRPVTTFNEESHIVNVMMGLKYFAVKYRLTGDRSLLEQFHSAWHTLRHYHGQAHGLIAGDEWLAGSSPAQGLELCAVVELMYSAEVGLAYSGEASYGDLLERAAFNALPATISRDFTAHQYDQQVNQISCTVEARDWTENGADANIFGLTPHFGCCAANLHQGWPKFVAASWMRRGKALVCQSLVPCVVDTDTTHIEVQGNYPFHLTSTLRVATSTPVQIWLRRPQWVTAVAVTMDGKPVTLEEADGYMIVPVAKQALIEVAYTTAPRFEQRPNRALSVSYGALLFAAPLAEQWQLIGGQPPLQDWAVTSTSDWAVAISRDSDYHVCESPYTQGQIFDSEHSPLTMQTMGYRVLNWHQRHHSAAEPPYHPELGEKVTLTLVPYGGAKLRISEFPEY